VRRNLRGRRRVELLATVVHVAVDLDDQARRVRAEVHDEPIDHNLPPEPRARVPSPERLPERELGGGHRGS